eukprot:scaffold281001_cov51-Prasinocladus_malaysianus.AAC.2
MPRRSNQSNVLKLASGNAPRGALCRCPPLPQQDDYHAVHYLGFLRYVTSDCPHEPLARRVRFQKYCLVHLLLATEWQDLASQSGKQRSVYANHSFSGLTAASTVEMTASPVKRAPSFAVDACASLGLSIAIMLSSDADSLLEEALSRTAQMADYLTDQ